MSYLENTSKHYQEESNPKVHVDKVCMCVCMNGKMNQKFT